MGYPRIIHFNGIFHYKPSVWGGTHMYGNPMRFVRYAYPSTRHFSVFFMLDHHMKLQAVEIRDWKTR